MSEITKIYKQRSKKSRCRGKSMVSCTKSCKYASGTYRQYCRKLRNKSISGKSNDKCVNQTRSKCKKMSKCEYASGSQREFCRKTRRHRRH